MENLTIFRARQALQADDLTNLGLYARDSLDHIVNDGIASGAAYWGFTATKTAATQVTLTAGRYYNLGAVYPIVAPTVVDLFSSLPLVTQKWVAIVAWGTDTQQNVQPRMFLIDPVARTTEPQSQPMEDERRGNIGTVAGIEGPQPNQPVTDSTVVPIAYVLMDTSGIIQVVQNLATQLPNLTDVEGAVESIEVWQSQVSAQLDSLATALANISAQLRGFESITDAQALWSKLNALTIKVNSIPAPVNPFIFYGTKYFLDNSGSDVGNGSFAATISEGITFPKGNSSSSAISLLNSLDPNVKQANGYILPTYIPKLRYTCSSHDNDLNISSFVFRSGAPFIMLTARRHRFRYGECFHPTSSADWWQVGGFDPIYANLAFIGESAFTQIATTTYLETVSPSDPYEVHGTYFGVRRSSFWQDAYLDAPYWNRITTTTNFSGQMVSQVFLNAQDGWLTNLGLFFTALGSSGDVDVHIHNVDANGAPDIANVIGHVHVAFADLQLATTVISGTTVLANLSFNDPRGLGLQNFALTHPGFSFIIGGGDGIELIGPRVFSNLVETTISIPPVFLQAGKRYAITVTTAGQHFLAMSTNDFLIWNDHHWYWDTTNVWKIDVSRVFHMNLYYASWGFKPSGGNIANNQLRYDIQMTSLQLPGGIMAIDVLAQAEVPSACSLSYQVQLGGQWYPLDIAGTGPDLSGLPALLPFKVVFQGTTDIMPGLSLTHSQVQLSRPASALTYLSTSQALGSPATQMKITTILSNFNGGSHTMAAKIKANSTTYTATTVNDATLADGTLQRDSIFNFGGAHASGTVTFTTNPASGTVTIGGTAVTATTSTPTGSQFAQGANLAASLVNLVAFLQASLDPQLQQCTYSASGTVLTVTYANAGTVGNSFTLATTISGATASGATLTGGLTPTPVNSYVVEIDGTTSGVGSTFRVIEESDFAKAGPV